MSRADYAHWNEEANRIWYEEEGKHELNESYLEEEDSMDRDAEDAFCEEVSEWDTKMIEDHLADAEYCARWPKAVVILRAFLADR